MIKNCLTYLFCFILSSWAYAQEIDSKKLDLYFTSLEQHNKFMGSVAVSQNGKIIYTRSIGFSDVANNIKANKNTTYRVGSVSKTFTATLILKAIEEKKIQLNQSIIKFFPSIQYADKITIENLLNHRSGIHNFTDEDDYLTWNTQAKTEKEMIAIIAKGGSDFDPGSKGEYSNSNYVLLTYILEKTFKKNYAELLKKYITKPLDLKSTSLGDQLNTANSESKSYEFADGWKEATATAISIPMGAGGIVSTPSDIVKFSDALFEGKIIKKESLERMKVIQDTYGLGLFQMLFYEKNGYGHRGGIDKFTAAFTYFPDDNISFALTSNGTNYNSNEIPLTVLSAVYNKPFDIPEFSTYAIAPQELQKYVGVYSSTQVPIKLTITKDDKNLIAQATGQSANSLEATAKDTFKLVKAGIILEFNPADNTIILKQGGGTFTFKKE